MASFASQSGHGFFDKVASRVEEVDSLLMVGLDPHAAELGEGNNNAAGAKAFCLRIIAATSTVAVGYKPNSAFFEAFGAEGVAALKEVIAAVPEGAPVLLDAKRGDIGTTADAYASGAFEELGAHAITLNAYMGVDTVDPFLKDPARGVFVLCKTSNKSSNELQTLPVGNSGKALFEEVASLCQSWNKDNNVGLVVGATDADALARVRAAAPDLWILAPGVGAQGGDLDEACSAALDRRGMGLLVPVSRGISRADDPAAEAVALKDRINAARKRCTDQRKEPTAAASTTTTALLPYQREFIEFSMSHKVLKFGDFSKGGKAFFELKSNRQSPYFFNAGLFCKGSALAKLGKFYAEAIMNARPPLEFDVVFGPAYKGIPLGAAVAYTLADLHDRDVGFSYNRKEAKDHGEGGLLVGEDLKGKRVLVVDDVITAGTAIREAFGILRKEGATPAGVVIALDRQEKTGAESVIGTTSAVQQVEEECGVPVVSVVGMSHLTEYMASKENATPGANAQ
ncbi:unnamed protein product, partial [Ectocarpus sp. 13 AM-2016]